MPSITKKTDGKYLIMGDKFAIVCNVAEPTKTARTGAFAYVTDPNRGNGGERVRLLLRSRGGRWIDKWEKATRLTNFRIKTIPPEHPFYTGFRVMTYDSREIAAERMSDFTEL